MIELPHPEQMTDNFALKILNSETKLKPELISMKEYMNNIKSKPRAKRIFGNYIFDNEVTLLAGETGTGKSAMAILIADCVTKGKSFLNEVNELPPSVIIYYDYELKPHQILDRYENLNFNDNFIRANTKAIRENHDTDISIEILKSHIEEYKPKVIFIDNIGILNDNEVQHQQTALRMMKDFNHLVEKYEVAIIVICHTPKMKEVKPITKYDIEGAAKIINYADNAFAIGRNSKKQKYLTQLKFRNVSENDMVKTIEIQLDDYLNIIDTGEVELSELFNIQVEKSETKRNEKMELAKKLVGDEPLRYSDLCYKYTNGDIKKESRAKQIIPELQQLNLILKNPDGKYILNRNEVPF